MEFPENDSSLEVLPNGLSLILDPVSDFPVISAQIWVETGSLHEGALLGSGVSHFVEHMVFKGAGEWDTARMAETVQAAGGHWNAYTTFDRTVYHIDGPAVALPVFLRILAAMVFQPRLPQEEFETEQDVIRREIHMIGDDPSSRLQELAFETFYTSDARRYPVIGHLDLFNRLRLSDLASYHADRYSPNRCCVCLSGDFQREEARALAHDLFGSLPRGSVVTPAPPNEPPQIAPRRRDASFNTAATQLILGWHTRPSSLADKAVLHMCAALLGDGRDSRLYREWREERSLALEIGAWAWDVPGLSGLFAAHALCLPEHRESLLSGIRSSIDKLRTDSLDTELEKARRQAIVSQYQTLTSVSGRASDLASNWHEARDLDLTRRYIRQLENVTADDIRARMDEVLRSSETIAVLNPEDTPAPLAKRVARSSTRPGAQVFTLPNGTTLALLPDSRAPLFSIFAAAHGGLACETSQTSGLSSLLASCLPTATMDHPGGELARLLESLGADASASCGNTFLGVRLSGMSEDLGTLLPLFGEILCQPALAPDVIEREKASQLTALLEQQQNPLSLCLRQLRRKLFGDSGYGLSTLGREETLGGIDREMLAACHARQFTGSNLSVAIAGRLDLTAVHEMLSRLLATLPAGQRWMPADTTHPAPETAHTTIDKSQAALALGYPGFSRADPRRYASVFLQQWCNDMAGPLFTRIREELGLAYQVGATQFFGHDTGMFALYLATEPTSLGLAETQMRQEIDKLADQPLTSDVFERIRATVISAHALASQSLGQMASRTALDILAGHPHDHEEQRLAMYQNLTPRDMQQAARALLKSEPCVSRVLPLTNH